MVQKQNHRRAQGDSIGESTLSRFGGALGTRGHARITHHTLQRTLGCVSHNARHMKVDGHTSTRSTHCSSGKNQLTRGPPWGWLL
jgi:hypothetical protein